MVAHHDILDETDSLRNPVLGSVALHISVFAGLAAYAWVGGAVREQWGDPNSIGGGSVAITPVSAIPIPSRSERINRVANDTESQVPQRPKPEPKKAAKEEPEAIPIKARTKEKAEKAKKTERASTRERKYTPPGADQPNQVYSQTGAAASSALYSTTPGGDTIGMGPGTPFGTRFGYYATLLRQRVAEKWRTQDLDPRIRTAPPVSVTFEILRNGSIRNVRVAQGSGIPALDYSAQRAIYDAAPFPELPAGFERDSAAIEFAFQLKR